MGLFKKKKNEVKVDKEFMQMITSYENYYAWDGKLYSSDIVRSCIRPYVKAIGKLVAKHIRNDGKNLQINPQPYIRYLLEEPNPLMTSQQFLEKVATQWKLNNNAFILKCRDENGIVIQMYPITATAAETVYKDNRLYIRFYFRNGKSNIFSYDDIIHLRHECNEHDIFGENPASALTQMMEVVTTADQGFIKAIKNSGVVRWLLEYTTSMRNEDLKKNVKNFVDNYLSIDSDTFGAAAVDSKAKATRIEPKDYVPNSSQTKEARERIFSFFNTNEKIVQSKWTEDEWNAYYEAEIEPDVIQLNQTYTKAIFTRTERNYGNHIVFESSNLACVSMATKLQFVQMVDRGAMLPNEWREMFNLTPVEGGDKPIRRLDTQVVNMIEQIIDKMDDKNYATMSNLIINLLNERREDFEEENQYLRTDNT